MDPTHPSSLPNNLEDQLSDLRARVKRLEEVLIEQRFTRKDSSPPTPVKAISTSSDSTEPRPAALPSAIGTETKLPMTAAAGSPPGERSLESRIGSQWFNRIGILAVLIGMSWFLKWAIDNHWIGPLGRVLIGLVAGSAIIAWSERFQRTGYARFAYSLKAVGSGILYLSIWAAYSLFHLMPAAAAFILMIAVTAFNGFMAWVQDAELLAVYSIVGGLSTPLLLSTGENHEIALFTYLLILNLAVLVLLVLRPWSRLLFGAFAGTAGLFLGWWMQYYTAALAGWTAVFLTCFFLIFALAPRLVRVDLQSDGHTSGWDNLALVGMPLVNAALAFLGFYAILNQAEAQWTQPWLAVSFAAFYLVLLRLPSRAILHASESVLSNLHLTLAVVFLTIAIPLKAHGRWLTIGWLVQGAALVWIANRVHSYLLRVLALVCLALGLVVMFAVNPPASTTPLLNERFGTYCVAIAVFAFIVWLAHHAETIDEAPRELGWPQLAAASVLLVNGLILVAVGWEIHNYWWFVRWSGDWRMMRDNRMDAQFTYSAFFMLYGALLLCVGFWRRSAFVRWQALVLVSVAIGKVFLMDTSALSQGYRILSFLGLGALLLAVSFVYQRDWLHLRTPESEPADRTVA